MRVRLIVLALLVAAIGVGVSVGVISFVNHDEQATRFDAAAWKWPFAWCTTSQRGAMVKDLVANRLRRGMRMPAARALLGAPDEVNRDGTWIYAVDFEDDFLLGTCVTLALYPKAGRLERAVIGR